MSDNVVALRETTAENPMRQQILDYVAQVLDETETPSAGIVMFIPTEDGSGRAHWLLRDGLHNTQSVALAGACITHDAMVRAF